MGIGDVMQPAVDIKDNPIIQIGFVVRDAVKMAKRYAEIFGIGPWNFVEGKVRDCILRDETLRIWIAVSGLPWRILANCS